VSDRRPGLPPRFAPPAATADPPLWSVMIPTYNCAGYLRETLASVLAQDPGPDQMQIEVVDDCSTDNPQAIVDELAPTRVSFHRQTENRGHTHNFNTCIERSRGQLVHLLHGDDTVRDGFYRTLAPPFHDHPDLGAAFCRYVSMNGEGDWETIAALEPDGRGILDGWLERIALGQRLQPPTIVVRRSVYEAIGGFDPRAGLMGEDWEMWVRIAAHYPVWYEPEPLALYRVHDSSITSALSAERYVRELRTVIDLNRRLLPPERADRITEKALEIAATTAIRRAGRLLYADREAVAWAQVRAALRTSRSTTVFERLALFVLLWMRVRIRRILDRLP
jgi:glycosyltransferase involved in cell wall biosynthesis